MNYLAIDTSSHRLIVTVKFNEKQYSFFNEDCAFSHSVMLNKTIESVLNEAGADFSDMDFFACALGPGSFTGIRIGVSAIKAFSYATGKPVLGVTSFEELAYNTQRKKTLALIDANNSNFYGQLFVDGVAGEPFFADIDFIRKEYNGYEIIADVALEGAYTPKDYLDGFIRSIEDNLNRISEDRETLVPLYVKKSQAEEK